MNIEQNVLLHRISFIYIILGLSFCFILVLKFSYIPIFIQENELIDAIQDIFNGSKNKITMEFSIGNEDRSFGTTTSYHVSR